MRIQFDPEKHCLHCMQELPDINEPCPYCGFDTRSYKPLAHHLQPFTILYGRYLIGSVLGEGGFGITYSAYDLPEDRRVAIKELFITSIVKRQDTYVVLVDSSYHNIQYFEECKDRFLREANALQHLSDKKGVVDIYDQFKENGTSYIVMEFLDGGDLLTYLKKHGGRIEYPDTFALLRPIMKSMIEIHRAGIIHRDISPDNIRYLSDHRMKLMDFGSAKSTTTNTDGSLILVKAGYAPPEQYALNYKIGPWMDVYAMGATFYRCICGKPLKQSTNRANDHDIEPLANVYPKVPPAVESVLYKALALKPENRFQDMFEFYMALKEASGDLIDPSTDGQEENKIETNENSDDYQSLLNEINNSKTNWSYVYLIVAVAILIDIILVLWLLNRFRP